MAKVLNDRGILRKLTWIPDTPSPRDFQYKVTAPIPLPPKVDLRDQYNSVFDQGELGSCTANAISMAIDFTRVKEKLKAVTPSRLFIYYNERVIEGDVSTDAGAMIRDGVKSVSLTGYCTEKRWPYRVSKFASKPVPTAFIEAQSNKVKSYMRLNSKVLNELKTCLAQGFGFVFGFTVFESFESDTVAETGVMPMPDISNESELGGHAVFCLGYDDSKQAFIVRNSWGTQWGDRGHFYMPYKYITDTQYCDDFWTIRIC